MPNYLVFLQITGYHSSTIYIRRSIQALKTGDCIQNTYDNPNGKKVYETRSLAILTNRLDQGLATQARSHTQIQDVVVLTRAFDYKGGFNGINYKYGLAQVKYDLEEIVLVDILIRTAARIANC